jgi:hypothetical protein
MNESKHPRAVVGLILLTILLTMLLGLKERSSAPLAAYSPASPLSAGSRANRQTIRHAVAQIGTRAFWLQPWPWIVVGTVGFGGLAWGIAAAWAARDRVRRLERD